MLELLIAVSIFAMVLTAINGVFYGAMRLQSKSSRAVEESLPAQQTVALLKRDLQGIVPPGGVLSGSFQSGVSSATTIASTVPPGSTTFYTCTGVIDETSPFADVQRVVYYLKNPDFRADVGKDLVRVASRNLLATAQEPVVEQWLMGGVQQFQLTFFDGTTWRDSWDSTVADQTTGQTNNLPRAVKVQIDLAAGFGEARKAPIQLVVPITVQVRTNQ